MRKNKTKPAKTSKEVLAGKRKLIIGVDEAGRGPLAGPITVAAVFVPKNFNFSINKQKIRDSKKLSSKQRGKWVQYFKDNSKISFAVSNVSAAVINKIGIQKAAKLAVARTLNRLCGSRKIKGIKPFFSTALGRNENKFSFHSSLVEVKVLLDGSLYAPKHYLQKTIIRGDETVPIISAASVVAKTARDKKMLALHKKFPQYGFDRHKGYGTEAHRRALKKHGLSKIHRKLYCRTFLKNSRVNSTFDYLSSRN